MEKNFSYHSEQVHTSFSNGHLKEKRNIVDIRNNKGTKTVVVTENGKTRKSTHRLSPSEKRKIQKNEFVPSLFKPCYDCLRPKSKSRSRTQKKKAEGK
jgi:histidinol phosphatase-like PHP family hydrolase